MSAPLDPLSWILLLLRSTYSYSITPSVGSLERKSVRSTSYYRIRAGLGLTSQTDFAMRSSHGCDLAVLMLIEHDGLPVFLLLAICNSRL